MRYIYYILFIVAGISVLIAYELRSRPPAPRETALTVNEKVITVDEFNRLYASRPYGAESKSEFLNDLIVRELLIQEAQKQGIDREESFRRSIQNFYEQSLIKILIDRKFSSLNLSVSDEDLLQRFALFTKRFHMTIAASDTEEEALRGIYRKEESREVYFDDLSQELQGALASLAEGETSAPLRVGEEYVVIRLDKVVPDPSRTVPVSEKDKIKIRFLEEKKEKLINEWISGLKSKATIKIPGPGGD
ncbi:MAG: peptidyl-prolyl cis-trans isomerase [Nitrospirota bacterium]